MRFQLHEGAAAAQKGGGIMNGGSFESFDCAAHTGCWYTTTVSGGPQWVCFLIIVCSRVRRTTMSLVKQVTNILCAL